MTEMDLPSFEEPVGLFPLPNVVLLPGGTQPLQIYEPRYRTLVSDALEAEAVIGMALLRPGYQALYYTNHARIHSIVCVGRIHEHVRLPDGRYLVNLGGLCRARVCEEDREGEYRTAMLEPMIPAETVIPTDEELTARNLLYQVMRWELFDDLPDIDECRQLMDLNAPLGAVVDRVAAELLPRDAVDIRQHLLEEMDVLRRTGTLLHELDILHRKLGLRRSRIDESGHPRPSEN